MVEVSRRAAAKPARGGADNAIFMQASVEALPGALAGMADVITVNYPWGSLLRAVAMPDVELLGNLAAVAKPNASLDVLVNMQPLGDAAYARRLGLANAALSHDPDALDAGYARAGWRLQSIVDVTGMLVRRTRWGHALHHARREVRRILAAAKR